MEDEKIRKQIADFAHAGIGGLHLHARAGLTIDYLGEQWFRAYQTTIDACKEYGLDIWIYDEQGWPSGFAGGIVSECGEDFQLKYLNRAFTYRQEFANRIVAAYRKAGTNYERTDDVRNADLIVYYDVQEHYVDLLNPAVGKKFIECTHEVYKRRIGHEFGKTVKGVFTDEPQIHVSSRAWSTIIPRCYREKYGEDVRDGLYLLFENRGENYQEFRYRYYSLIRELFVNNYIRQISEWCESNGLILTGHFAGEEGLCVQVASNTGVMPHYEFMRQPGIDHLGRRLNPLLLLKQIQSVANQLGKKRILSETYACTGNGVSFGDLAWIWNYQAAFGVNMPCMSISMYRIGGVRKRDYPVFISSQQPWWPEFSAFSRFLENTSEFVSEGAYSADVLLISAINSALEEPLFSLKQKNTSARYRRLAESLAFLQIPYEIGDETLLAKYGRVEDDCLHLGNGRYRIIVLPELDNIELSTIELLEKFSAGGGKIVCMTGLPARVNGAFDSENGKRLEKLDIAVIQQRRGIIEKYFSALGFKRKVSVCDEMGKPAQNLICNAWSTQSGENIVVFNPSVNASVKGKLCFADIGGFTRVDMADGTETDMPTVHGGDFSFTDCELPPKGALYFRFAKGKNCRPAERVLQGREELSFRLAGTGENILTLDYARYKIGEGGYSEKKPLVHMIDEIYERAEQCENGCKVSIEYTFSCAEKVDRISLVGETAKADKILVNNNELACATREYFLDEDFKRYDISRCVNEGSNKIVLEFTVRPLHLGFDLKTVHDSVRNKFSYPIEPESIYLVGDFSVRPTGAVTEELAFLRTDNGFTLEKPKKLPDFGDLTENGLWFYAGNADYEMHVTKRAGKNILHLEKYYGAAAKVSINGERVGLVFLQDGTIDLTPFLKDGGNIVTVTVLGTLRNMLGPHHHFKGDTEYTGIHTYTGEYGNGAIEDLSSEEAPDKVWTDTYGFIRFGLEKVSLINQKI